MLIRKVETIVNHPLNSATTNILKIINNEARAIWPTASGYVSTEKGLLATGTESVSLTEALAEAQVPVVYVPAHLSTEAKAIFADRMLSPKTACDNLSSRINFVKQLDDSPKLLLVEFILSEQGSLADANEDMLKSPVEIMLSRLKSGIDNMARRVVDDI